MIKVSYYFRKRVKDYLIHFIMLAFLIVTLFPIGWMIYTSLKENTDILVGKIPLSNAHNDVIQIDVDKNDLWVFTSDGGINKLDAKTLKEKDHASAQTMTTHFLLDGKYVWISSGNHGLLRYNKNNLKSKNEFDLRLPPFDKAKVVGTTLAQGANKIYFTMQYKGYEKVLEIDPNDGKILRTLDVKNKFSPSQVRCLLPLGNVLYVGLDKGLLQIDLVTGKIARELSIGSYLPLGIERMKPAMQNIVLAGNTGAFVMNPATGNIVRSLYPTAVQGLRTFDSKALIGTNRGYIEYDLNNYSKKTIENLFRQVRQDGTTVIGSDYTPSTALAFDMKDGITYAGSTYGRISVYDEADEKVVNTGAARQGHLVISWVNYVDMWKNVDFGLYLRNSVVICGISMVFAMFFATMAAYALARFDFPGAKLLSLAILATQMVPGIMFLIPIYSNFVKISEITGIPIKGTYWGMIFVYSAFFIPFSVWILRGFFAAIPVELEEAASIDGCSPFQTFWHVVLPLAVPGIVATGIYVFLNAWDELIFAWVLTSGDTMTIPVGIRNFVGNYQNRFDLIMAAAVVATIPVMILFFLLQKHIVKGLTAGAVKG